MSLDSFILLLTPSMDLKNVPQALPCLLYYGSVRLPALSAFPCLYLTWSRLHPMFKAGSPKFKHRLFPTSLHGLGPRQAVLCTHLFFLCSRAYPYWLQASRHPGPLALLISGLDPFAFAMDECYLPSGLIRFVASSYAEFSSDLMVSL